MLGNVLYRPLAVGAGNTDRLRPIFTPYGAVRPACLQSRGTVGVGRLAKPIANPYPLKPCRTATLVNLSKGTLDPL